MVIIPEQVTVQGNRTRLMVCCGIPLLLFSEEILSIDSMFFRGQGLYKVSVAGMIYFGD